MDNSNILCWLIPLLVGLICAILGYLLGRLLGNSGSNDTDFSADLDACKSKNSQLQRDLDACNSKSDKLQRDLGACKHKLNAKSAASSNSTSSKDGASMASGFAAGAAATAASTISNASAGVSFDGGAAKMAFGKKVAENDLTIVEGIGPKIKELFHNFDIKTWAQLGATSVEKCQEVLNSGGKRYKVHNPKSWPMQSEMAAQGKWAELKKWQDEHDSGKM